MTIIIIVILVVPYDTKIVSENSHIYLNSLIDNNHMHKISNIENHIHDYIKIDDIINSTVKKTEYRIELFRISFVD